MRNLSDVKVFAQAMNMTIPKAFRLITKIEAMEKLNQKIEKIETRRGAIILKAIDLLPAGSDKSVSTLVVALLAWKGAKANSAVKL